MTTPVYAAGASPTSKIHTRSPLEGVIIAQDDDLGIRRALSMARNIQFMKYRVEFHLEAAE